MSSELRKSIKDEIKRQRSDSNMGQSELLMDASKFRIDSLIGPIQEYNQTNDKNQLLQ